MKHWEERVFKEVLAASHQRSLALRDSLPEYLNQLSRALSTADDQSQAKIQAIRIESQRIGRKHGHERAGSLNYTLDQLIFEYHILRQVICDVMEEEAMLTREEREIIVSSIEQAVSDAATQFSDTLHEIQQSLTHALAHDLRSPITTAKSSAQLLLRRPDNVDYCIKLASYILKSMDRLDSMIHDLLDASRIKAGQSLPLQFKKFDLDLLLRQVASEVNFIYENRFVVNSSGQCLGYWSESGIRRVIENLAVNAAKYGAPHTPIIMSIQQIEKTAIVTVHNQGKPISAKGQSILFQQFSRMPYHKTKIGWGLGLTVVKGIIEAHHGTVQVESKTKKGGTVFKIELPKDWRKLEAA